MGRRRTRAELILPGEHSTMSEAQKRGHYTRGCTHDACRKASSEYEAERQRRKRAQAALAASTTAREQADTHLSGNRVPALGASRRLQGLLFAGHSPVAIASPTRIGVDAIWWLLMELVRDIDEVAHRVIEREFKAMRSEAPAPRAKTPADGDHLTLTCRALARKNQWASAWAWTDIDLDEKPTYRSEVAL